jgi:hypothetical protein
VNNKAGAGRGGSSGKKIIRSSKTKEKATSGLQQKKKNKPSIVLSSAN